MQAPVVFCPKCGAADTSMPDVHGIRFCVHCQARYQIAAPMAPVRASGNSTPVVALTLAAVGLLVAGAAVALFFVSDSEPAEVPESTAIAVAEPEPKPPEPEPKLDPTPEPENPTEPRVADEDDAGEDVVARTAVKMGALRPDPALRYRVDVEGANVRGPADAPVTIVVFYDFECPFCKRLNGNLAEVTERYGDDVRIAYMHNPLGFHERAMPAAKAVEAAAAQGKFWEMYGLLFENEDALAQSDFDAYARKLGLDKRRFDEVFEDSATERRIKAQQAEAVRLEARGTPSSFVNGRFLRGTPSAEVFSARIDEELEAAKKLIADGTPRSKVHDALMKDALPGV